MGPSLVQGSTCSSILGLFDNGDEYLYKGQSVGSLKPRDRAALNRRLVGFVSSTFTCWRI